MERGGKDLIKASGILGWVVVVVEEGGLMHKEKVKREQGRRQRE